MLKFKLVQVKITHIYNLTLEADKTVEIFKSRKPAWVLKDLSDAYFTYGIIIKDSDVEKLRYIVDHGTEEDLFEFITSRTLSWVTDENVIVEEIVEDKSPYKIYVVDGYRGNFLFHTYVAVSSSEEIASLIAKRYGEDATIVVTEEVPLYKIKLSDLTVADFLKLLGGNK